MHYSLILVLLLLPQSSGHQRLWAGQSNNCECYFRRQRCASFSEPFLMDSACCTVELLLPSIGQKTYLSPCSQSCGTARFSACGGRTSSVLQNQKVTGTLTGTRTMHNPCVSSSNRHNLSQAAIISASLLQAQREEVSGRSRIHACIFLTPVSAAQPLRLYSSGYQQTPVEVSNFLQTFTHG